MRALLLVRALCGLRLGDIQPGATPPPGEELPLSGVPGPSDLEKTVMENGPTLPPEIGTRMQHGCLWQPGFFGCTCEQIMGACGKAAHVCDAELEELTAAVPETSEYNLRLQLDHPLLNTLQVSKASNTPMPYAGNIPPEQFDWRLFHEAPPSEATMTGTCTPADIEHYQKCLRYFQACYKSYDELQTWTEGVHAKISWAEKHPAVRPGLPAL
jgi:hypothetical protein